MILYVSHIGIVGSGYGHIGWGVCNQLHGYMGHEVVALSTGYYKEEYDAPFRLVPTKEQWIPYQVTSLCREKENPEVDIRAVILAQDIPRQIHILKNSNLHLNGVPVFSIFPVESDPLTTSWMIELWRPAARFVISRFGVQVCEAAGLPVEYLEIPPAPEFNPDAQQFCSETRAKYGLDDSHFLIVTVAENHERKNLWNTLDIFSRFAKEVPEARWVLVTRMDSPVGWVLDDALWEPQYAHIKEKVRFLDRKLSTVDLARLYGAADLKLLTSKAEGLGIPIREAQAVGCLTAGTDCTSLSEQLCDGKGLAILSDYDAYRDPWGNSKRYFASIADGVEACRVAHRMTPQTRAEYQQRAWKYVGEMAWEKSVKPLKHALLPYLK